MIKGFGRPEAGGFSDRASLYRDVVHIKSPGKQNASPNTKHARNCIHWCANETMMVQRSCLPLQAREVEWRTLAVGVEQLLAGECGDSTSLPGTGTESS